MPRNSRILAIGRRAMRRLCLVLLWLLAVARPATAETLAETRVGFAADRVLVINGRTYNGKIWAMPGRERHDQVIEGMHPVFLLRGDSPLGEVVLAQLKTIVQFVMPPELRLFGHDMDRHPIGQDTIEGIAATKYAIDKVLPEGHAEGTLWLSQDAIPLRLIGTFTSGKGKPTAVRWELSHLRIGPQPAALFVTPQGYSMLPAEAMAPLLGLRLKGVKH
jgi:hypothetical protein